MTQPHYSAVTFAPVQGFIEKSRKLRDLYGASLLLSHLSKKIIEAANKRSDVRVISPGLPNEEKGMPNRILIKGVFSEADTKEVILSSWQNILKECQLWVERNLTEFDYHWKEEWKNWGNHTWEVFGGSGNSIPAAMKDLETRKLSRDWTAVNWIGESSSLTGTDAIAFPGLGAQKRNPRFLSYGSERDEIISFYTRLAEITEEPKEEPEGKFIAPNEKLSIPELVKRLVTWDDIAQKLDIKLDKGVNKIPRKPTQRHPGQWTGWFMGDGDEVGKHLKEIALTQDEEEIKNFTCEFREWGLNFYDDFSQETKLGRVIYAGGDDFLGVIYSENRQQPVQPLTAYEWLLTLQKKWQEDKEHTLKITLSVGFVWVAGSVPQRDVLQHCREAEKRAKSLGRDRITIRIVFNSGQYVEWTCPWEYLAILKGYSDRDGKTYPEWESSDKTPHKEPNWSHIYSDLAQLKARHAFGLAENRQVRNINNGDSSNQSKIIDNRTALLEFFYIYFPNYQDKLRHEKHITGIADDANLATKAQAMIDWIEDLITVGWHLCSNTLSSSNR